MLDVATDLGYLSEEAQIPLIESITEIQKMLSGLKKRLKATP